MANHAILLIILIMKWNLCATSGVDIVDYNIKDFVCLDSFDQGQCFFIEKTMKAIINSFEQKMQLDKLDSQQERRYFLDKIKELKLQIDRKTPHALQEKYNLLGQQVKPRRDSKMLERKIFKKTPNGMTEHIYNKNKSPRVLPKAFKSVDPLDLLQIDFIDNIANDNKYAREKNVANLSSVSNNI